MVLGKFPVPGRPTIWMIVGQGPIALAVGAGGWGMFGHFSLLYLFSPLSPHISETARYRLKYCLKALLNQKQKKKRKKKKNNKYYENVQCTYDPTEIANSIEADHTPPLGVVLILRKFTVRKVKLQTLQTSAIIVLC